MGIVRNSAWQDFLDITRGEAWTGTRIKDVRSGALMPGGRTRLTLFEQVDGEGRPHPRLRVSMPPAEDPAPVAPLMKPVADDKLPRGPATYRNLLDKELERLASHLDGADLDPSQAPKGSERFWRLSISRQRINRFFVEARALRDRAVGTEALDRRELRKANYFLREREDEAYGGDLLFDDHDTGTYHSFGHDAPFVHYLERLLESLPDEASDAFKMHDGDQQESLRRQRAQVLAHLDFLMTHKYAHDGIHETDIERSLGGFLICKQTRNIVSEVPSSRGSLVPAYELLRIAPAAEHPDAGAWVYRNGDDAIHRQDHSVVDVDATLLRSVPRKADGLSFRRDPKSEHLREGVRFDWDRNGYVQADPIGWISWAGHCDIKAVMEQLGITLTPQDGEPKPQLVEYRAESGAVTIFERDLLVETVASVLELGSAYRTLDGTGQLRRGVQLFGGARNDSRPDRLQFTGPASGKGFRWPLTGRQEAFTVTRIQGPGGDEDMESVFSRWLADLEALDFAANPRFLKTIEGDYNLISVAGARIEAKVVVHSFDKATGYLHQGTEETVVDLRDVPEARARWFLGTHLHSAQERTLYRVYYDGVENRVVAELERWDKGANGYAPVPLPDETVRLPFGETREVTLSREMKLDDPVVFQSLLGVAMKEGRNICADTDSASEVWNGVVKGINARRLAFDHKKRTEHWTVTISARFGDADLTYLLRRDREGEVEAWCPLPPASRSKGAPDFLWSDYPDVGSKGVENGQWIVNQAMAQRDIVDVRWQPSAPGGYYVHDDHIKNTYELIWAALGGLPFTILHGNKRWGFADEASWTAAVDRLNAARGKLSFD